MYYPDRNRRVGTRRSAPTHVPVELAQQLVNERDKLAKELEAARRANARLEDALEVAQARAEAAELRADELVAERESQPETNHDREKLLEARVASLTSDLERVRTRMDKSLDDARRAERSKLVSGLGSVLDSVERALRTADADNPWRAGLEGIEAQLHAYLRDAGVTLTGEVGESMDPSRHEAVAVVDTGEFARGEVASVERRGMVLEDGTVARTAQVTVAR